MAIYLSVLLVWLMLWGRRRVLLLSIGWLVRFFFCHWPPLGIFGALIYQSKWDTSWRLIIVLLHLFWPNTAFDESSLAWGKTRCRSLLRLVLYELCGPGFIYGLVFVDFRIRSAIWQGRLCFQSKLRPTIARLEKSAFWRNFGFELRPLRLIALASVLWCFLLCKKSRRTLSILSIFALALRHPFVFV